MLASAAHQAQHQHSLLLQYTHRQRKQLHSIAHASPPRGQSIKKWHNTVTPQKHIEFIRQATAHGTSTEAQVNPGLQQALPFTVNPTKAKATYMEYQEGNALLAAPQPFDKVGYWKPYWRYDIALKIYVRDYYTQWYTVHEQYEARHRYGADDYDMQVFASRKYLREDVNHLKPGDSVSRTPALLQLFAGTRMLKGQKGSPRRVVPYTMSEEDAWPYATPAIGRREQAAAREYYRSLWHCLPEGTPDRVEVPDLDIKLTSHSATPVYVPAYVFTRRVARPWERLLGSNGLGPKVRTFVSGCEPGVVSGAKVYNEAVTAILAAGLGPVVLMISGQASRMPLRTFIASGMLGPALLVALLTRYYPSLRHAWSRLTRR